MRFNFGKNIQIHPKTTYSPTSEPEVLAILDRHRGQRIRVVGRLHSWSKAIETDDVLLDLRNLNQVETMLAGGVQSAHVGAGCQIKRLLTELQRQKDWTLPSVGFITEQTIAGAISTGTHGSGKHSLSHYVLSVRIARYDEGSGKAVIQEVSDGPALQALRCSLGCIGVIVSAQMQCRQAYSIEESFHEFGKLPEVVAAEETYPLQQFYLVPWRWTYFVQHRREVSDKSSRLIVLYHWYRFLFLDVGLHLALLFAVRVLGWNSAIRVMIGWIVPVFVLRGWRVVGPSNTQLVMEHELFRHIELELFVQKSQLGAAMQFLKHTLVAAAGSTHLEDHDFQHQIAILGNAERLRQITGTYCHHYPICVRKILVDDTLISMASPSGQTSVQTRNEHQSMQLANEAWYSITLSNFEALKSRQAFESLCGFLTQSMSQLFGARPHWGKLCPLTPSELKDLYPRFNEFRQICWHYDPSRAFRNRWADELLGPANVSSETKNRGEKLLR
jgi:hypothetical protein